MTADDSPGLRERKKRRTRDAVRRAAFRLFDEQGYAETTVEQIAEAAEVSPRTFFRYFPSKESLLVSDELIEPIIEEFVAAPGHLNPVAAYRYAVERTFTAAEEWEFSVARQRMLYALPEAKGALYNEYIRTMRLLTAAIARRQQRPPDDEGLKVAAGAITGVLMAAADDTPMSREAILRALDILDAGWPNQEEL